jgi:hypothetical protein
MSKYVSAEAESTRKVLETRNDEFLSSIQIAEEQSKKKSKKKK